MANTDNQDPSFVTKVPSGEDRERNVCTRCGFIDYQNPKIVAGSVATDDQGRVLLCRRAIEPRSGYWTIPAGYMELHETVEDAARREAVEEACAELSLDQVLAVYSVPHISQVQVMFRARLDNPGSIAPGPESREVALVAWEDIPWSELAFPSVHWALKQHRSVIGMKAFPPFGNPKGGG